MHTWRGENGNIEHMKVESYDFVLTDVSEALYDHSFLISAYAKGEDHVYYYQNNGMCDSAHGISYNEIVGTTEDTE